jgi:hypothetical protein
MAGDNLAGLLGQGPEGGLGLPGVVHQAQALGVAVHAA